MPKFSMMLKPCLAMNPNLSLDELNAALQHKVQDRNHQPHPDFVA